ncbi:hypothetical protein D9615_008671 [Tricholomella constricta]|uniref:F-box domain-containing protein n=1 Tax=Tricholomella constricta TaxID=117010 RepID=A0A8H5H4T6_9AGAR|nr:hypothetical protein D9615_008671 [Tricholomella constricta]
MNNLEASAASLSGTPALPTEILSKVFLHCTDIDGSLTPANTIHVPLLLTKVCRSWRTIAIGTRFLWSRLYLSITPNATYQTALVSTWLARSGACPLKIYIMWNDPPFFMSHPVLDILVQHSHHWHSMYFFLPNTAYRSLSPIQGNLPLLAELSLGTHEPPPLTDAVIDAFSTAPNLRSLECVNLHPYTFSFPWAHLSHIPIMTVTVDDALDILRRAPRLASGSFICSDANDRDLVPARPPLPLRHIHLLDLAVLAPEWNTSVQARALFTCLTAPHLHSLRICNVTWPFGASLLPFLARVDALESLYLRKTALAEGDVLAVLELLPALKHLAVLSSSMFTMASDVLLERLTWRPPCLCPRTSSPVKKQTRKKLLAPRLETLEITLPDALNLAFVELLESRWSDSDAAGPGEEDGEEEGKEEGGDDGCTVPTRLRRVEVGANDEYDEEIMRRLEVLAQAGMTIIIGSTDVPLEDGLEYMSARYNKHRR